MMTMKKRLLWAVMGLAAMSATSAIAADLGGLKDAPVYDTESERAIMIRGRMLWVVPGAGSGDWTQDGSAISSNYDVGISNSVIPELDISYFFRRNLAVELILGATKNDIVGRKDLAGTEVGSTWLLPPTLLLQYHFDLNSTLKPYVGAGANYTFFFNEDAQDFHSLKLDNTWGWALQAGVDIHIAGPWYANIDVKKLWLNTDATLESSSGGHIIRANVDIDPWIVGVGLGYKFDRSPAPLK